MYVYQIQRDRMLCFSSMKKATDYCLKQVGDNFLSINKDTVFNQTNITYRQGDTSETVIIKRFLIN